jgi:hypothetical protein
VHVNSEVSSYDDEDIAMTCNNIVFISVTYGCKSVFVPQSHYYSVYSHTILAFIYICIRIRATHVYYACLLNTQNKSIFFQCSTVGHVSWKYVKLVLLSLGLDRVRSGLFCHTFLKSFVFWYMTPYMYLYYQDDWQMKNSWTFVVHWWNNAEYALRICLYYTCILRLYIVLYTHYACLYYLQLKPVLHIIKYLFLHIYTYLYVYVYTFVY